MASRTGGPTRKERPQPAPVASELVIEEGALRLTHYLFRYPAKFHPPVVRALIEKYTEPGDVILDPFCGSGTLLVEAATMNRRSIGLDIDPVAVAVTNAKVHRYAAHHLQANA